MDSVETHLGKFLDEIMYRRDIYSLKMGMSDEDFLDYLKVELIEALVVVARVKLEGE